MTPNHGTNPSDERRRQQSQPPQTPPQQQPQQVPQQYIQQQPQPQQMGGAQQQGQPVQQQPVQQQQPMQQRQAQPLGGQTQRRSQMQAQPAQQQQPQQRAGTQQVPEQYLTPARINELITEDVVTAAPDTPLQTIVAMMAQEDVGSVIIVKENKPVGIITDRKVAMILQEVPDISDRTAQEFVQDDLTVADPSMSLFDALQLMNEETIRRLPIVDDDGTLRGIATLDDILVMFGSLFQQISDTIEAQSERL